MSVRERTSPHTNTTSAPVSPSSSVRLATAIAFGVILVALRAANEEGTLRVHDPEIVTRFLWGALRRGAILVATSPTRSAPATPFPSMRALVWGLCCDSSE
ncbi:MAG: hypothetical protein ACLP9Y_11700 [Mycobacterium sp.]|jgi:hypothetical protein|uniref:hypothetical protein n=1 Tax=Mycobacterium sp. TaxID=1785 RepID=UPI003F9D479E